MVKFTKQELLWIIKLIENDNIDTKQQMQEYYTKGSTDYNILQSLGQLRIDNYNDMKEKLQQVIDGNHQRIAVG